MTARPTCCTVRGGEQAMWKCASSVGRAADNSCEHTPMDQAHEVTPRNATMRASSFSKLARSCENHADARMLGA